MDKVTNEQIFDNDDLVENVIGTEGAKVWAILNKYLDNNYLDIEEAKQYIIQEILELK